ncbi:MAG: aldo/keto reductase [Chloroflexota bacterium]
METKQLGRSGTEVPALGLGTWRFVKTQPDPKLDAMGVESLRLGIEQGLTLIDTAEMYGAGHSEEVVGQAIKGMRERIFLASKVLPRHFAYQDVLKAARASLSHLGTDYMDLYQLHWPSTTVPLEETMGAMEELVTQGLVRFIGVSNFSVEQMRRTEASLTKEPLVANQVRYNPLDRAIEADVLPYAQEHGITIIAYSPFAHGELFSHQRAREKVEKIAEPYGRSFAQAILNWLIAKDAVITIPKAIQLDHVREDAGGAGWRMQQEDYEWLEQAFR